MQCEMAGFVCVLGDEHAMPLSHCVFEAAALHLYFI